jgi:hypothetical protein
MWAFIWLGLLSMTVLTLLVYEHHTRIKEGFVTNVDDPKCPIGSISPIPGKICTGLTQNSQGYRSAQGDGDADAGQDALDLSGNPFGLKGPSRSEIPTSYTIDIVKQSKILQAPFPPCVGYVDEVVYAPSDTNADIADIKAELALLQKNMPNYIADGVNQQTGIVVKGMLRQYGFPLADSQYGPYGQALNCN